MLNRCHCQKEMWTERHDRVHRIIESHHAQLRQYEGGQQWTIVSSGSQPPLDYLPPVSEYQSLKPDLILAACNSVTGRVEKVVVADIAVTNPLGLKDCRKRKLEKYQALSQAIGEHLRAEAKVVAIVFSSVASCDSRLEDALKQIGFPSGSCIKRVVQAACFSIIQSDYTMFVNRCRPAAAAVAPAAPVQPAMN